MLTLTSETIAEMEACVKQQIDMLTKALGESARYGKCPVDVRGALLRLMQWIRSDKRDFIEWAQVTNNAHGEWLDWYLWIEGANTKPLPDCGGLTGLEVAELFVSADQYSKRGAA